MYDSTKGKESQLKKMAAAKKRNAIIADWIEESLQIARAERLRACGSYVMWNYCNHCHHSEIIAANYCKDRFCAICAPKKANRTRFQILKAISPFIKAEQNDWIFLTVTVRSVTGEQLKETVADMLQASRRFFDRRPIEKAIGGYIRSLEITYNQKTNMFHPHIHMLLMVDKAAYFTQGIYLTQEKYADIWKDCARLTYTPIVDVRKVYDREGYATLKSAVIETAKYPVKLFNIPNHKIFRYLDQALKGKQLIAAGGALREHWRLAEQQQEGQCCANPDIVSELYKWNTNGYKVVTK